MAARDQARWDAMLRQTLEDRRLSRSERRALGEVFADQEPDEDDVAWLRSRAFDIGRAELDHPSDRRVLDWLEGIVKLLRSTVEPSGGGTAQAWFTPGDDAPERIANLLRSAARTVDICVFTITDDRIARAIVEAHRRAVAVRIITDDLKADDRGSDIDRLHAAGIPVRTDQSDHHMHHKFAIFDQRLLLTGSYNWTRSAARDNQENFVVVDDPKLVRPFTRTFADLWEQFDPA